MRKLSEINEGLFTSTIRRGYTDEKRKEDKHRFDEPFRIIKESEHIDLNLTDGTIWTSFNFGSDAVDKPGYYMNLEDIIELKEYLMGTNYHIATYGDFQYLKDCYSKWIPEKVGDYYGFNVHNIHILNFGYISCLSKYDDVTGKAKNDSIIYGDCAKLIDGYRQKITQIRKGKQVGELYGNGLDKVQVRLIKHK